MRAAVTSQRYNLIDFERINQDGRSVIEAAKEYRAEETLLDGRTIVIRAIRPQDRSSLLEISRHLSERSIHSRFLFFKKGLSDKELAYFTEVDFKTHVALLAAIERDGKEVPIGVSRYIVIDAPGEPPCAEPAVVVEDDFQGLGVGTLLLRHLAKIAKDAGVLEFVAYVLSDNREMMELLEHTGLELARNIWADDASEVRIKLA